MGHKKTNHRQAMELLDVSEQLWRNVVDSLFLFVGIMTPKGIMIEANPAALDRAVLKREDVVGKPFWETYYWYYSPSVQDQLKAAIHHAAQGKKVRYDVQVRMGENHFIIVDFSIAPIFDSAGQVTHLVPSGIDITARKRAEEALRESEKKYRSLFEASRDAIYMVTQEGKVADANQAALDLFGYTREELIGMNAWLLSVDPDDWYRYQQDIEQKGSVRDYEVNFHKKDGTVMNCLLTSTIRRATAGNIIGYQGIVRDITEKRKMEGELLKAQKLESLGILAGGIAHDFNNMLTAILGNISITRMDINAEDQIFKRLVETEKAALRAKDLTQQLLTFSKGGIPIKKIISIAKLIKESVSFAMRGSNSHCEFSILDDLWPVEIDEGQISQVINNLIINAHQAMPEGGIIKVRAENIFVGEEYGLPLKEGRYVKITFIDKGIGIPEKHLPNIFDPYFSTKHKGSGLGLATSYSIIKNHGGYITAESELGLGTTFYFYLPVSERDILTQTNGEENPLVGYGKVLVMDDEETVRDVVGEMLSHMGYEVKFAQDGTQVINLYTQAKESGQPFDVVIMDLTVPCGMGGKEAIKNLLEIDPNIKAIVSSGYSNDPIMSDFRLHGFSGVLPKPFKVQELGKILHEVTMGANHSI